MYIRTVRGYSFFSSSAHFLRSFSQTKILSAEESIKSPQNNEGKITTEELLRMRKQKGIYWHEEEVGGKKLRWNYRSELVKRWNMDHRHIYTSISIVVSIILGVIAFGVVKSDVMESRRIQMAKKEALRREKLKNRHGASGTVTENQWDPEELKS